MNPSKVHNSMSTSLLIPALLVLLGCCIAPCSGGNILNGHSEAIKNLHLRIEELTDQVRRQQLSQENDKRLRGNSGLFRIRDVLTGPNPYDGASYVGRSVGANHNHADDKYIIGTGEIAAILNGVEFKTRHNDYLFKQPSKSSKDFMDQDYIDLPDVPKAVLDKNSPEEQIVEMRKWVEAFQTQNTSVRDYRPFFKANLCYLEGGWSVASDDIKEPFPTKVHKIKAENYRDLEKKFEFVSETGTNMPSQDLAHLPRKIIGYKYTDEEDSDSPKIPVFAQWNYRLACHPLKDDLPTAHLHLINDQAKSVSNRHFDSPDGKSRICRFRLNDKPEENSQDILPKPVTYDLLDKLMQEIPGKDNYPGYLEDATIDGLVHDFDSLGRENGKVLNAAYYHRKYSVYSNKKKAFKSRRRGFSDETIFMAMNSREEMSNITVEDCFEKTCRKYNQKWSFAIPIEIVYSTPLHSWNPYGLETDGSQVSSNGRKGGFTMETAFNGTDKHYHYLTPAKFYADQQPNEFYKADSGMNVVGVLDRNGEVKTVRGSGHRILLPMIPDVTGRVRTRYPVGPIHEEGSAVWRELSALRKTMSGLELPDY